ncbi:periplasmic substrate binding protein TroA [Chlamydia pneumoniae TW-183]|nr:periplasmic substrate binding protein TroA [Chlamydia pneumoniae TW-183]
MGYIFKVMRWIFCFVACGITFGCTNSGFQNANSRPCILSMNRMIHDCVERVVGNRLATAVLIKGSLDPHAYEMVKGDKDKIAGSAVIFCNGLGLEHTLSLRKHLENNPNSVKLGERLIARGAFVPLEEDGICDPHIWMDLSIWKEAVIEITEVLIEKFPEWSAEFKANSEELVCEMSILDSWAKQCLSTIPENLRYLVSGHNAFSYFTRRYLATPEEVASGAWRSRCISPEGLSPEAQISVRDIMAVVDYINEHDVSVVFPEDTLNQDALKKIVSSLKKSHLVRLAQKPLYSDNVDDNYFSTFKHNVCLITEELGGVALECQR